MRFFIVFLTLVFAVGARAEERKDGPKRTTVRFDGDNIDGTLQRPEGDLLAGNHAPDLPPLASPPASFARASRRNLLEAADAVKGR